MATTTKTLIYQRENPTFQPVGDTGGRNHIGSFSKSVNLSLDRVYSVTTSVTNGYRSIWNGADSYSALSVAPSVSIRTNTGITVANTLSNATIESLKSQGVTSLTVSASYSERVSETIYQSQGNFVAMGETALVINITYEELDEVVTPTPTPGTGEGEGGTTPGTGEGGESGESGTTPTPGAGESDENNSGATEGKENPAPSNVVKIVTLAGLQEFKTYMMNNVPTIECAEAADWNIFNADYTEKN